MTPEEKAACRETWEKSAEGIATRLVVPTDQLAGRRQQKADNAEDIDPFARWGFIDWTQDTPEPEPALVGSVWPAGASITITAAAGRGKSYLALYMAARLALGQEVLGTPPATPKNVLYLDLEMDEALVRERVESFGIELADLGTAGTFHYSLPFGGLALDTEKDAIALLQVIDQYDITVLIIDTMSKIVDGPENDNDTFRELHRQTAMPLKARNVSVLMLDHLGHKGNNGRGASAKAQNVDVPWLLTTAGKPPDKVLTLKREKVRSPRLGANEIHIQEKHDEANGRVFFFLPAGGTPPDTRKCMDDLIELAGGLEAAADLTHAGTKKLLRDHHRGRANNVIEAATATLKNELRHKIPTVGLGVPKLLGTPTSKEAIEEPF